MEPLLSLKNIDISFGGVHALQGVNFDVFRGEILGLIGPNGSGKSTCVNVISGTYKQDIGDLYFEGEKLLKKESMNARVFKGISRTFQTPKPFVNLNVYDNIYSVALQLRSYSDARQKTNEILEETGLAPFSEEPAVKLPIEKRKWLDLARILAMDPKLIMMDEVMAGLNPSEMDKSLGIVRELNKKGITVLFIEHVMKAVTQVCDRVVVLKEGKVLCSGRPYEILDRQDVIEAYLGRSHGNVNA